MREGVETYSKYKGRIPQPLNDMYHPKVLWNHSLYAQHRQGGEKRAGIRDCKLSSLLSEDKNDLLPQEVATDQPTDRSDLFYVT